MNRQTLSHYGWTIVLIIILCILMIFSSTFGDAISNQISSAFTALSNRITMYIATGYDNVHQTAGWECMEVTEEPQEDGSVLYYGVLTKYTGSSDRIVVPNRYTNPATGHEVIIEHLGLPADWVDDDAVPANILGTMDNTSVISVIVAKGVSINDCAFAGCHNLKMAVISDGISSVGSRAFENCEKLSMLKLPNSMAYIGPAAFAGCASLEDFRMPESLASVSDYAFSGCTKLSMPLVFPKDFRTIGNYAFENCSSLKTVDFKKSAVYRIGEGAFKGTSLACPLSFPSTIYRIEKEAFTSLPNLTGNLENLTGLVYVGDSAFEGTGLTGVDLSDSKKLQAIGNSAFKSCSSLGSGMIIPGHCKYIGSEAFSGCSSIRLLTLNEGLTSIGGGAFNGLSGLESQVFVLPSTVNTVGGKTSVNAETDEIEYVSDGSLRGSTFNGCRIRKYIVADNPNFYASNDNLYMSNGTLLAAHM